jgi:hypothetical protein
MTNTVNTQRVGCDEQELVNGVNIAENLQERIAILFPTLCVLSQLGLELELRLALSCECCAGGGASPSRLNARLGLSANLMQFRTVSLAIDHGGLIWRQKTKS